MAMLDKSNSEEILEEEEVLIEDSGEEDNGPVVDNAFTPIDFDISHRRFCALHRDFTLQDLDPIPVFSVDMCGIRLARHDLLIGPSARTAAIDLYRRRIYGREVVIDGQQRLTTFFAFIDGKFPKDESSFKLGSLRILSDLNGKSYKTLPEHVRRDFLKYTLSIIKIGAKSYPDIRFEIFERLNTGSVSLSEQELRNCLYRGTLNSLLRELSEYSIFRSCLGVTRAMPRMRDVEMALRFIAFYDRTFLNLRWPHEIIS